MHYYCIFSDSFSAFFPPLIIDDFTMTNVTSLNEATDSVEDSTIYNCDDVAATASNSISMINVNDTWPNKDHHSLKQNLDLNNRFVPDYEPIKNHENMEIGVETCPNSTDSIINANLHFDGKK